MRTGSVLWSAVVVIGSLFTMCCAYTLSRSKSSKKTKNKKTDAIIHTNRNTRSLICTICSLNRSPTVLSLPRLPTYSYNSTAPQYREYTYYLHLDA